jgi:hypothetical protein
MHLRQLIKLPFSFVLFLIIQGIAYDGSRAKPLKIEKETICLLK